MGVVISTRTSTPSGQPAWNSLMVSQTASIPTTSCSHPACRKRTSGSQHELSSSRLAAASRSVQAAAYAAASSSGVAMEVPCLDRLHDLRALAADETFGLDATPHVGQGNAHGLASLELSNSRSTST